LERGGEGLGVDWPMPASRLIEHVAAVGPDDRLDPHAVLGRGMNSIDAPDGHVVYQPGEPDLAGEVFGHRPRPIRGPVLRSVGTYGVG
jgi:hypothetical protein